MTTTPVSTKSGSSAPTALLAWFLAVVLAGLGNTVVSLLTRAAGASDDFRPLQPATYLALTVIGLIAGVVGWLLISRGAHPRRTLTWVVPLVIVVSWAPDVIVGATHGQPHTTWTAVLGLMVMHVVVAASACTVFARLLPLRDRA